VTVQRGPAEQLLISPFLVVVENTGVWRNPEISFLCQVKIGQRTVDTMRVREHSNRPLASRSIDLLKNRQWAAGGIPVVKLRVTLKLAGCWGLEKKT